MSQKTAYDFEVKDIEGKPTPLSQYKGKPLLIVNVASRCGYTPQYEGLQKLHETFGPKGLVVMGFPCNQFGAQEPGTESEIKDFCSLTYDVNFPMFAKVDVNGPDAAPLYEFLKSSAPGLLGTEAIKWNFTKFLVDRSGKVVHRYAPQTKPEELVKDLEAVI